MIVEVTRGAVVQAVREVAMVAMLVSWMRLAAVRSGESACVRKNRKKEIGPEASNGKPFQRRESWSPSRGASHGVGLPSNRKKGLPD